MKSLAKKIAEVTAVVKHPPQSGRNKFHNYDYSTRDDIFGVIRGELATRGVALIPSVMQVERESTGMKTRSGAETIRFVVRVSVVLIDSETGEESEQVWEGEAHTEDDKGVPQAVTQALRFWATNTFMLLDGSGEHAYGQSGGGQQSAPANVQRQEPAPTSDSAKSQIEARLLDLKFDHEQVAKFLSFIAGVENKTKLSEVHPGKLALWAQKMSDASDEDVRKKVLANIGGQEAV